MSSRGSGTITPSRAFADPSSTSSSPSLPPRFRFLLLRVSHTSNPPFTSTTAIGVAGSGHGRPSGAGRSLTCTALCNLPS